MSHVLYIDSQSKVAARRTEGLPDPLTHPAHIIKVAIWPVVAIDDSPPDWPITPNDSHCKVRTFELRTRVVPGWVLEPTLGEEMYKFYAWLELIK